MLFKKSDFKKIRGIDEDDPGLRYIYNIASKNELCSEQVVDITAAIYKEVGGFASTQKIEDKAQVKVQAFKNKIKKERVKELAKVGDELVNSNNWVKGNNFKRVISKNKDKKRYPKAVNFNFAKLDAKYKAQYKKQIEGQAFLKNELTNKIGAVDDLTVATLMLKLKELDTLQAVDIKRLKHFKNVDINGAVKAINKLGKAYTGIISDGASACTRCGRPVRHPFGGGLGESCYKGRY